jgi:hypothetical protein
VLGSLPLGLTVNQVDPSGLVLTAPGGGRLDVDVKALGSPAPADVERLVRPGPSPGRVSVLVADRIVPRVREQLSNGGWGWLDRRGHLYLATEGLLVDTDVPPLIEGSDRRRPTLDTDVGLDVAVALLAQPDVRLSVRQLVTFADRSLGAVHHAIRGLRDEGLLGVDGRPLTPELFGEVAARWRPRRVALGGVPDPEDDRRSGQLGLGTDQSAIESAIGWAVTDTLAANAYGAAAVVRGGHPPDFYVPDERTLRVARQLFGDAVTPERRKATVGLPPVSWVCQRRVDLGRLGVSGRKAPWPAAHPVVVALDLSVDTARGREILEEWAPPEPFERVW